MTSEIYEAKKQDGLSTLEAMMNISEEEQNSTRYNINGEASISIEHSEVIEGDRDPFKVNFDTIKSIMIVMCQV